ncbi:MAG: SDR family oxidoreductase [Anaerolineae bacterium]|nr:SDR family oxidoreductase [Anaerolineae bacterium]
MTNYLVTGGAGFIGSHLVQALVARGDNVRVLDNFTTGRRENLAWAGSQAAPEVMEGDVRDLADVQRAVAGADYVLHQAAVVSVQQSLHDPLETHEVNATGTLNVLRAALEAGVQRVVLASSCAVYGDSTDLPLRESTPLKPLSPYAASKIAAEGYCRAFSAAYGLPTVCLRYFNVYGPRQNPDGEYAAVIARFAQRMKGGQPPLIYGDGEQSRDFVHVGDAVRANLLASADKRAVGEVFNVASGQQVSLLALVELLNDLLGTRMSPLFEPERAGDIRHSVGDGGRAAAALQFRPQTSLADGLRQLIG